MGLAHMQAFSWNQSFKKRLIPLQKHSRVQLKVELCPYLAFISQLRPATSLLLPEYFSRSGKHILSRYLLMFYV